MTNEIINKMIEEINFEIENAVSDYKRGNNELNNQNYARINGMIRMLVIATGKRYYFDESGLHERKTA